MSRIFLSHSSRNNAEALAIRQWLATQGWNDVFLDIDPIRGLVAAERWQKALNAAIGRCRAVIFLLSPEWRASEHCFSEFNLADHIGAERVGVIVKDIAFDRLPGGFTETQIINLTRGGTPLTFTVNPPPERRAITVQFPDEELRSLRVGLARLGLVGFETESFPWPPSDEPNRTPFRGLEALDIRDAGVLYGRDIDLVRAREHLLDLRSKGGRKLLVIQGASGSGKSSFLGAGLLPRLEREDRDFTTLPLVRPSTAALSGKSGLAAALEQAFGRLRRPRAMGDLLTFLEQDPDALTLLLNEVQVLAIQRLVGDAKPQIERPPTVVVAIDQAEELFAIDAGEEGAMLRQHLAMALNRGPDTIALLTIRSDRFSLLQRDNQLTGLLDSFNLPPMSATVYHEVILRPAARLIPPLKIEPKLTEALINDAAAEGADPLPLLAFTLERLYRWYGEASDGLLLKHYERLGGIAGSINAAIADAFPPQRDRRPTDKDEREDLLEAAFVPALVDINPTNGELVSRTALEQEIPTECRNLVSRLVEARLLVSDEGPENVHGVKPTTYRVSHEALLRRWDLLKRVLDRRAGQLRTVQLIERQAEAWDKARRSRAWLDLRGERLRDALDIADQVGFKNRVEGLPKAYLTACKEEQEKLFGEPELKLGPREGFEILVGNRVYHPQSVFPFEHGKRPYHTIVDAYMVKGPANWYGLHEVVVGREAVAVLITDRDKKTVFVRAAFRLPTLDQAGGTGWVLEPVYTVVLRGQSPEKVVMDELLVETGYEITNLQKIATFFPYPRISSTRIHLYWVEVENVQGKPVFDRDRITFEMIQKWKDSGILHEWESENEQASRFVQVRLETLIDLIGKETPIDGTLAFAAHALQNHALQSNEPNLKLSTIRFKVNGRDGTIGYKTGSIENVKDVHAWVNPENTDMMMDRFMGRSISAKIRYLGSTRREEDDGIVEDTIQESLRHEIGKRGNVKLGTVLVTKPGTLGLTHNLKLLFHVAAAKGGLGDGATVSASELGGVVKRVLACVDRVNNGFWRKFRKDNIDSVIFPMIGSGEGGVPVEVSAKEIIPAAIDYFLTMPDTTIKEIYFSAFKLRYKNACDAAFGEYCNDKRITPL